VISKNNNFYTYGDLLKSLRTSGLKNGQTVFLTSSLGMCGNLKNIKTSFQLNKFYLKALKKIILPNGNLIVPTYSYSFSNDEKKSIFNVKKTKSKLGSFSNFFLKQKNVIRTNDPMLSVAGLGPSIKKIFSGLKNTSYGKGCLFDKLTKIKNVVCLNLCLGTNWLPFIHHIDWINKVPFRYDKYFKGEVIDANKHKKKIIWHYPVRYLRKETDSNGYRIGNIALKKKIFKSAKLGRSLIYLANYKKFFYLAKKLSKKDPWITAVGPKFKTKCIIKK